MELKFKVDELDELIDEKGNSIIALRKVSWNDRPAKLELRKWYVSATGELTPNKGFSFLTEEGPHELVHVMLKQGYGDTRKIIDILKDRDPSLEKELKKIPAVIAATETADKIEYFNPKELLEDEG